VNAPLPTARPKDLKVAEPEPQMVNAPLPVSRPKDLKLAEAPTPVNGVCEVPLDIAAKNKEDKLDVLFVVDTSKSLREGSPGKAGELARIAAQMDHFVANFPENTDINIGVMLGHGETTWNGRLFQSSKGDPAVLKTREIRNRADLVRRLEDKMKKVPNESGGAEGEALLYSLFQSINVAGKRNEIIRQGLYRTDASLAVILVSDEQDVCFDYSDKNNYDPTTNAPYKPVAENGAITGKRAKVEEDFFKKVCMKADKGGLLRPDRVHEALTRLKGGSEKLVLMGLVYTSKNVAAGKQDENEMGHGIIQLVRNERTDKLVDLGSVEEGPTKFAKELSFLGKHTQTEMHSSGAVACVPQQIHPQAVDLRTVQVEVLTKDGKLLGVFQNEKRNLRVDNRLIGGRPVVQAFLDSKTLNTMLTGAKVNEAKARFNFKSRVDRDQQTGKALN